MSTSAQSDLSPEAADILSSAQRKAMNGIAWTMFLCFPILLLIAEYNRRRMHDESVITYIGHAVIIVGPLGQFLLRNRFSIREATLWFLVSIGTLLSIAYLHFGPLAGGGAGWATLVLIAVFFIGRRAGLAVIGVFALIAGSQAVLIRQGLMDPPRDFVLVGGTATLVRIGFGAFIGLVVSYVAIVFVHRALRQALIRVVEEKSRRDNAEAAQQRAEEIMKANQHYEALGKLASGVAHDVNNALTSVLGHAELLRYSLPEGEEQTYAKDIIAAARSAAHTTRQLLSLNRRTLCQPVSIRPMQVVDTVSRLIQRLIPEKIKLNVDCQSERVILVDPADLQQALLNLLLNARDAIPGDGTITIRVIEQPAAAPSTTGTVLVEVSDTGVGMPPAILARIFEPFFTTKPVGHGTGLGLAMVRLFVDEAGGQISVASTPGKGTTVRLIFPESPLGNDGPHASDEGLPMPATGQRILVVEDQPELCALIERVLGRGGFEVRMVASADAALLCLAGPEKFDLLCTDGVVGTTPVHRVIDRFRDGRPHAPVLICSGHLDDELVRTGMTARAAELLRKPFSGTELLARVRKVLRQPEATL